MTKGKKTEDNGRDLTRIEDLSEFLHVEDNDVDDIFEGFLKKTDGQKSSEFEDNTKLPDLPVSSTEKNFEQENVDDEVLEEVNFTSEVIDSDINFDDANETIEDNVGDSEDLSGFDDSPFELSSEVEISFSTEDNTLEQSFEEEETQREEVNNETPYTTPTFKDPPLQEKFEEVKKFAQNFSYGQIQSGGNPPFSLIIRNLKYFEDAADVLIILREMDLITDQNSLDTKKSLELGSLLVPQISEYSAIHLAHKLRRFDCDIEVGLSDEVHPSKSGDSNPRGLTNKDNLRQNKIISYKKDETNISIQEIIVSTTPTLEGFFIKKYIGVQTSFTIVDEDELERLKFVQKSRRVNAKLQSYETDDSVTSERAFSDYQNSFDLLFTELCDQLKVKAMKINANALLSLNYQLTSLPFEKTAKKSCFQLTCSATLATVQAV